jgi:hypothetical protein
MAIALYRQEWRRIARREGVPQHEIELTMTYKGKRAQFASLCAKLAAGEFLICEETCDQDFLSTFYDQARNLRFNDAGRSLIRFDDCANVVSFCCDPAFRDWTPEAPAITGAFDPFAEDRQESVAVRRSLYCGV